jgi:hypothetical protein
VARSVDAVTPTEAHARAMQGEREAMRASVRALGDAYHPVDLRTGERVSAEEVRERLQEASWSCASRGPRVAGR